MRALLRRLPTGPSLYLRAAECADTLIARLRKDHP